MESKPKIYILFIDFSKAYDSVDRRKIDMRCGCVMLLVIIMLYRCIQFILKSAIIIANQGVRQGASTSSVLFILYMDKMVQMMKSINEDDGFLAKLHTLVLLDDIQLIWHVRGICASRKWIRYLSIVRNMVWTLI